LTHDTSIVALIGQASLLVQFVMLLLLLASVFSWAIIFHKGNLMRRAKADSERFEHLFWSGGSVAELYNRVTQGPGPRTGMPAIFEVGFREYTRLRHKDSAQPIETILDGVERSMRVALTREMDRLEEALPFLATVGSISPYIGLFGTVWGIMSAFIGLSHVQNATLQVVAPSIAEALIATAMGLFAAIPAVVGYNRYTDQADRLFNRYDNFLGEFVSLLHRQGSAAR
jgi:biopolymer transport protein TolQ